MQITVAHKLCHSQQDSTVPAGVLIYTEFIFSNVLAAINVVPQYLTI